MSHLPRPVRGCRRFVQWSRRDSNPRPLDPKSITLRRRPGGPGQGVERVLALCQLSYGPCVSCCAACGWRGGTLGPGTGSRVPRASGSAPAGHPFNRLAAPFPASFATSSSRGRPANENRPTRPVAGGAIVSLPGCGKGHALKAPALPELPRWLSLRPSCSRAVACRCHESRLRNRTARRAAAAPPHERTSAPRRPAHAGHATGDAKPASFRGLPASLSSERACIGAVSSVGCRRGGTDPPETQNRAADVLPQPWLRGPLRGPWRARGRGGRGTSGRDSLRAKSVIAPRAVVKCLVRRTGDPPGGGRQDLPASSGRHPTSTGTAGPPPPPARTASSPRPPRMPRRTPRGSWRPPRCWRGRRGPPRR